MRAGERACACPECGVVCEGLFDGCPDVWARGPRPVTLTNVAALGGNGVAPVRALNAGPVPPAEAAAVTHATPVGQAASPAAMPAAPAAMPAAATGGGTGSVMPGTPFLRPTPPPPPPPSNGFGRGRQQPPPRSDRRDPEPEPVSTAQPNGARTEILRWFEDAFDEVRNELHAVVSTVTRQQAMLAELLDSREAELKVVMVAESLPELAGEAAAKALADQSDGLADVVAGYLEDVRVTVQASEESGAAVMDGMRELLRRVELTAELNAEEAHLESAARLEALKASLARQLKPIAADVAALAAEVDAAQEREAARTRALKAAVTKQIQPLAARLDEAVDRSDRQLAEIRARLDALAATAAGTTPGAKTRRRPSTTPRA